MEEDRCFCHFGGFLVKDAKARKDIESLKEADAATGEQIESLKAADAATWEQIESLKAADAATGEQIESLKAADAATGEQIESLKAAIPADYIEEQFTHIVDTDNIQGYVRTYKNGIKEAWLWNERVESFTQQMGQFYTREQAAMRISLEPFNIDKVPNHCIVTVSETSKLGENGEKVNGPFVFAMQAGEAANIEGYGVCTPGIMLISNEMAENVTVKCEIQCMWYDGEEAQSRSENGNTKRHITSEAVEM